MIHALTFATGGLFVVVYWVGAWHAVRNAR